MVVEMCPKAAEPTIDQVGHEMRILHKDEHCNLNSLLRNVYL